MSFDAGTGTLTYTGTGSPMPNLVISLAAVNDGLVEGSEQYTVSLSSPGSTTGANVVGSGSVQTTITDVGIATWSLSGDAGVTEGNAASYTVHLDGTLQAGETATVHLALADNSTTSADHASFTAAVIAAIGARTDLSFDAGTGTLTYTGTGSPMPNLVISLAAVNDGLVEGPEQYKVSLSSPGSTTGANVVGSGSVQTTIADVGTLIWSLSGDPSVTQGNAVIYTLHLDGTLQAGETATAHLAAKEISTDGDDLANFAAAVTAAIGTRTDLVFNPNTGTLTYTGTGGPMPNLVISLATLAENEVEGPEQLSRSCSTPAPPAQAWPA